MFTGIVQRKQSVAKIHNQGELVTLVFDFPQAFITQLVTGASVAINGVCLTVRQIEGTQVSFDVIKQTLAVTNIGQLSEGDWVNIERAAKIGDEIGGHLVSGHIYQTVEVLAIEQDDLNMEISFSLPENLKAYIFNKGFVALNGCSLTIAEVADDSFKVCLIPETRDVTVFGQTTVGQLINLEVDPQTQAIVERLQQMVAAGLVKGS